MRSFLVCTALITLFVISGCMGKKSKQPKIDLSSYVRNTELDEAVSALRDTNTKLEGLINAVNGIVEGQAEEVIKNPCEAKYDESYISGLVDVAKGKPVRQVDYYDEVNAPGSRLTDGERNADWPCAHTGTVSAHPWMTVDLGDNFDILAVYILNRYDCCGERTKEVEVYLGVNEDDMQMYFYNKDLIGLQCIFRLRNPVKARYVKVALNYQNYLNLGALEVYSVPLIEQ